MWSVGVFFFWYIFLVEFDVFFYVCWEVDVVIFVDWVNFIVFWNMYIFMWEIEGVKWRIVGKVVYIIVCGVY